MKKPSFIIGKKQVILSCLTLMLAVAVYVNYALSDSDLTGQKKAQVSDSITYGDTEFINAPQASSQKAESEASDSAAAEEEQSADSDALEEAAANGALSASDYFAQARLNRSASRDEAVSTFQTIMGGGDLTEDERVTDSLAAVETSQLIESESNIESMIKSMGYQECIVYLDGESAKVVVQTEGLDSAQAAAIKDVILGEISVPSEKIRIFEVK